MSQGRNGSIGSGLFHLNHFCQLGISVYYDEERLVHEGTREINMDSLPRLSGPGPGMQL